MKKKIIIITCILVLVIFIVIMLKPFGTKPFKKFTADKIISAEVFIVPPETTIKLTDEDDIIELTDILNELVIYREDDSGRDYSGQFVQVIIKLKNGDTYTVGAYNPFLFVNDKCYRTKYDPCERLNAFGNRILGEQ